MLRRRTLALAAAAAVLALVVAAAALSGPAATTTLKGTVGPGFTITLKNGGKKVTSLKAGTYKFVVADKSSIHGFTLEQEKGGKWEKDLTSVPGTGTKTTTVKLKKGSWKFYCPPHESGMHGEFTVK
jgi:plastocyanin